MRRMLLKEFRPLFWPGLLAVIAAVAPFLVDLFRSGAPDDSFSLFRGLAFFAFVGSLALLASLPFGLEIQERTLSLLLSQPIGRNRLWALKLLVVLLSGAALAVLYLVLNHYERSSWQHAPREALLVAIFLFVTLCSSGFWTLLAGSTIGGTAFTLASQLISMLVIGYALETIYGPQQEDVPAPLLFGLSMAYAGMFFWLGWRKFNRLQLRDFLLETSVTGWSPVRGGLRLKWLQCRSHGYIANLIRKELHLQKPVATIAMLVSLCWLGTLLVSRLTPGRKFFFEGIANVLTGVLMVLVPLLAGCISLGEEKALGVNSWQLTFPVAAWKQWLVKLAVSAGVALGLGLLLPCLLAWLSSSFLDTGLAQALHDSHGSEAFLVPAVAVGMPFLLSFWAATMLTNTVRAALLAVAVMVVLVAYAALGVWCALQATGIETALLKFIMAHLQLSGEQSQRVLYSRIAAAAGYSCTALGIMLVLIQSLAQFRRACVPRRLIVYYAASITGLAFLVAFWLEDLQLSHTSAWRELKTDVVSALQALPGTPRTPGQQRVVNIAELENTGQLSASAKAWLKQTTITIQPVEVKTPNGRPNQEGLAARFGIWRFAMIRFPDGKQEFVGPYEVLNGSRLTPR